MLKASLPLASLLPGKHYNLRLALPGGADGRPAHLYLSAVLTGCPRLQQRHVRAHAARAAQLVQARLAAASAPLRLLQPLPAVVAAGAAESSDDVTAGGEEVFAVWRLVPAALAGQPPLKVGASGAKLGLICGWCLDHSTWRVWGRGGVGGGTAKRAGGGGRRARRRLPSTARRGWRLQAALLQLVVCLRPNVDTQTASAVA